MFQNQEQSFKDTLVAPISGLATGLFVIIFMGENPLVLLNAIAALPGFQLILIPSIARTVRNVANLACLSVYG